MAPRSAERNQALREASRKRILDAAIRQFSRNGYASTSIRAIALEAGLAQGLLYSHFRGKEDLLRALFKQSMADVRESFAAAAPGGTAPGASRKGGKAVGRESPRPSLEKLVRSGIAILRRNLDFWRLSYGVRMQESVVIALGPELKAWTRDILLFLESLFRMSGSKAPGIEAALFFAAFDGICQHYALDPGRYPLDEVADALLDRFQPVVTAPAPGRTGKSGSEPSRHPSGPSSPQQPGASHGKPSSR